MTGAELLAFRWLARHPGEQLPADMRAKLPRYTRMSARQREIESELFEAEADLEHARRADA